MVTVFAFIIIAGALFAVAYPLWVRRGEASYLSTGGQEGRGHSDIQKESLYATIKELDFDFKTSKLSAEDYEELREKYRAKAMALFLEAEKDSLPGEIEGRIEEEIKSHRMSVEKRREAEETVRKGETTDTRVCSNCGKGVPSEHNFCPYCGKKLPVSH